MTVGIASSGTSPRPLSKIRTSFVTVEKSGQMGLQLRRENSGEPSLARRRTSFSIDEVDNPKATAERKESIASEFQARKNSLVIAEVIPESAIETPSLESDKRLGLPKAKAELKKTGASTGTAGAATSNGHTNGASKPATKSVEKITNRPAPISVTKVAVASKSSPIKSPLPRTPTTPRGRGRPAEVSKKELDKKSEKTMKASLAPSQSSKPATQPVKTAAITSKTRHHSSPPQTGFVKPKPRSPTRPVKLPASLTAHTASSGSKTATASAQTSRQSLSRASGSISSSAQAHHVVTRSPSRTNSNVSTLHRKPSNLNKASSRPSLGPPPSNLKNQPSRQSLPPSTAPADDGFLARMMRPTTSSASKVLDHKPETPPKRAQSARRPATSDGPSRIQAPKVVSAAPKAKDVSTAKHAAKETHPARLVAKKEVPKETHELASEPAETAKAESLVAAGSSIELTAEANLIQANEVTQSEVEKAQVTEEVVTQAQGDLAETGAAASHVAKEDQVIASEAEESVIRTGETAAPLELTEPAKEVLTTIIEPPTPVAASAPVEEEIKEHEPAIAAEKKVEVESAEPVISEEHKAEVEEAKPEAEDIKHQEVQAPATTTTVPLVLPLIEEKDPEAVPKVTATKPKRMEDPEDVKAREEIAKLNADLMKGDEAES